MPTQTRPTKKKTASTWQGRTAENFAQDAFIAAARWDGVPLEQRTKWDEDKKRWTWPGSSDTGLKYNAFTHAYTAAFIARHSILGGGGAAIERGYQKERISFEDVRRSGRDPRGSNRDSFKDIYNNRWGVEVSDWARRKNTVTE
jgi:hypothetical protein